MIIKKLNLPSILGEFDKTITKLDALITQNDTAAEKMIKLAEKLQQNVEVLNKETSEAEVVKDNINALLGRKKADPAE